MARDDTAGTRKAASFAHGRRIRDDGDEPVCPRAPPHVLVGTGYPNALPAHRVVFEQFLPCSMSAVLAVCQHTPRRLAMLAMEAWSAISTARAHRPGPSRPTGSNPPDQHGRRQGPDPTRNSRTQSEQHPNHTVKKPVRPVDRAFQGPRAAAPRTDAHETTNQESTMKAWTHSVDLSMPSWTL